MAHGLAVEAVTVATSDGAPERRVCLASDTTVLDDPHGVTLGPYGYTWWEQRGDVAFRAEGGRSAGYSGSR